MVNTKNTGTLVFLHYFGGSRESWKWTIPLLEKHYECIALNLPGFGGLEFIDNPSLENIASFVSRQIKELNIERCILIGHSMGGKIAVQTAIENATSQLIEQLILIAPSPPSMEWMVEDQKKILRHKQDEKQATINVETATILPLSTNQMATAILTQMEVHLLARKWWIDEGINQSIADKSRKLNIPVTVIASETDPAITQDMTFQETIPNLPKDTKLLLTREIGHLIPLENPVWLSESIKQIINPF